MMKKNGFTLAEVLITLSIIGVVATMTLPALMTNTQEQQAKTGLKKAISVLSEAVQMHQAVENTDYATLAKYGDVTLDATDADNKDSLATIFHNRLQLDYKLIGEGKAGITVGVGEGTARFTQTVPLRDGTAIIIPAADADFGENDKKLNTVDNLPVGFVVVYDTNGFKGPNVLSNCAGNTAGASEEITAGADTNFGSAEEEANDFATCGEKGKRVIKDQFLLRLRGTYIQPEGPAATWAFNN